MRVLYINTKYEGGGAERVARQLYWGTKKYGIETYMLAGIGTQNSEDYASIYDDSQWWNWLYSKATMNAREYDRYATMQIIHFIRENKIELVHFHNTHGNYMGMKDMEEVSKLCPVVWTMHDMWSFTGHCAHADECTQWKDSECSKCNHLEAFPRLYWDRAAKILKSKRKYFCGKGIVFVTPSRWLQKLAKQSIFKEENIRCIPNGVDIEAFIPGNKEELRKKYGIITSKKVILFLSAHIKNKMKGFSYLLNALNQIENPEEYLLLVAGNSQNLGEIKEKYETIEFGYVSDIKKLNDIYAMADVFVVPSMSENFPCVILESMASGTPVVAFETGGIPEQIDEETGWLVEKGNAAALKETMVLACEDSKLLKKKSGLARKKVESQFSEKRMIEGYIEIYKQILGE